MVNIKGSGRDHMLDRKEHLPPTTGAKPNFLGLGAAKVPIFIVGAPRSGTTLMQCMLSANEATYSLPETHFFCTILPELAIPPSSPVTSDQLDDINAGLQRKMAFRWPDNLLTALLHKAEVGNIRAFEVFDALLECFRPEEGSTELRPVEKTPFHVFYLGQILEIYPHARFVHLIRDPRRCWISDEHAKRNRSVPQNLRNRLGARVGSRLQFWASTSGSNSLCSV